jgi:cytochrome c oxidase subunit 2
MESCEAGGLLGWATVRDKEKEQRMGFLRSMAGWAPAAITLLVTQSAFAGGLGNALPWQMGLQDAATPVMESIHSFHTLLLVIITAVALFVLGLLVVVMIRFNAKSNPVPSRTTHNTLVEVVWTVVPILILIVIAIPSFRLLYLQRDIPPADMTIKAIGNQWYWSYEYPDNGGVSFDSIMKTDDELTDGDTRLLSVDNPTVVPVGKVVRVIVTASDVLHAWAVPSFGVKVDAVPGRLNELWFKAETEGVFYGQCSELCGKDHAAMPIEVHVVSEADFSAWAAKAKAAGIEDANRMLAGIEAARGKLAAVKQ